MRRDGNKDDAKLLAEASAKRYMAARLSDAIRDSGLTSAQVARTIGVAPQTLSNWTAGRTSPDTDSQVRLCAVLEISIAELYPPLTERERERTMGRVRYNLRPEERSLIHLFRRLNPDAKARLLEHAKEMVASRRNVSGGKAPVEGDS